MRGAVGTLQTNLYVQVRALKLDLEARYPGFDLPTKHPFFSWLVKHAQWLLNRNAIDGLTPNSVGAMRTVVHGVALLRLWTSVKLVSSLSHFQHGKKDFGLAATLSRTSTLWRPRKASTRPAHFVGVRRRSRFKKTCWSHLGQSRGMPRAPARRPTTLCFLLWARAQGPRGCSHKFRPTFASLPSALKSLFQVAQA